jgi:hypothetical protein
MTNEGNQSYCYVKSNYAGSAPSRLPGARQPGALVAAAGDNGRTP